MAGKKGMKGQRFRGAPQRSRQAAHSRCLPSSTAIVTSRSKRSFLGVHEAGNERRNSPIQQRLVAAAKGFQGGRCGKIFHNGQAGADRDGERFSERWPTQRVYLASWARSSDMPTERFV